MLTNKAGFQVIGVFRVIRQPVGEVNDVRQTHCFRVRKRAASRRRVAVLKTFFVRYFIILVKKISWRCPLLFEACVVAKLICKLNKYTGSSLCRSTGKNSRVISNKLRFYILYICFYTENRRGHT